MKLQLLSCHVLADNTESTRSPWCLISICTIFYTPVKKIARDFRNRWKPKKLLLLEAIAKLNQGLMKEQNFNSVAYYLTFHPTEQQIEKPSLGLQTWKNLQMAWSKPHQTFSELVSLINKMQVITQKKKK